MNYLEQYYSGYDEDGRLLSRHGQVEYQTTMKYIHQCLGESLDKRILEVGAGTGRYSVTLAKEGYQVDAVELTSHNLEILKSKLTGEEKCTAIQGNAMDLSMYADETFDVTLVLGPMYHLYCNEDKCQVLREAIRVTKKTGYVLVAYCMNESVIIQEMFVRGHLKEYLKKGLVTDDFKALSCPEELFDMERVENIYAMTKDLEVERIKLVATDGATNYMRAVVDAMDDETFEYWLKYHFATCERQDIIGATNHALDILQRRE